MKEKIKEFWDKNKTVIIIGAASAVAGGVISVALNRKVYGEAIPLVNMLRSYDYRSNHGNTIFGDMILAQKNANHVELFSYESPTGKNTLGNLISGVKEWIDEGGCDPDVKIAGLMVFYEE